MTDGGDGTRDDGTDRLAGDHSKDDPTPPAPETRTDGSTADPQPQPVRRRDSSSEDESMSERSAPLLGEPTRTRLAREQAQTADLERGPITEYTTDRRSLAAGIQIQWTIRVTILSFVFGLIITAALSVFQFPMAFGLLAIGLLLGLGLVWVVTSYRIWVYQIRDDSLYLERGVVTHVRTIVPFVRIQHVDTSRSALERALGLSTLVVYTAGSRGADVSVPGLKPNEARDLQQRLKELTIETDGDDAL